MKIIPENIGPVVALIRLETRVITPLYQGVLLINRQRARNPGLDIMIGGFLNLLEDYAREFYPDMDIAIGSKDVISESCNPLDPFFILILVESSLGKISEQLLAELYSILQEFVARVLEHGDDFFTNDGAEISLTIAQSDFLDRHTRKFIIRHEDKNISSPFICEFPGENRREIPVQGRLKRTIRQSRDFEKISFIATSDGAKGSDLLVYLRKVDTDSNAVASKSEIFVAESYEHTKTASAAHADGCGYVRAVAYEKLSEKGQ